MPKVSVIVATYRRDNDLERALKSLQQQNYRDFEIIVVDDNDDENWNLKVAAIIENYKEIIKDIKITYMQNHPNMGSAKTRNRGIEVATGDYICFLDDDDEYLPDRIINQVVAMEQTIADYSLTDLALYNESGKMIEIRKRDYIKSEDTDELLKYHLMYHMTGTDVMMFKRSYLHQIGGFDPIDVGDEFYLMLKAIENAGEFVYVPVCDVRAYVHTGEEGLSSGESKINGENCLYEYKQKRFDQLSKECIRYIKARHFAVLAYAYLRMKNVSSAIKYSLYGVICAPMSFFRILLGR